MKIRSLALTCLLALAAAPAIAADIPARMVTKAPVVVPAFSWTGFYVGGNVGYGFGNTTGALAVPPGNFDVDGIFGGGQVGANYQVGNWVFGVEADYQAADIDGSSNAVLGVTLNSKVDRFGTVRGRLGYAWDRWMIYGTGGYAFDGHARFNVTPAGLSSSRTLDGWAAGAGVEYAFAPNWSAKFEYLHVDLDDKTFFPGIAPCVAAPAACRAGVELDTVRVGLNYRFYGGGARW